MQAAKENLVRKQYLISSEQIKKLEVLAEEKGTSSGEIVRSAIDAYDPHGTTIDSEELMELVAIRLKEAITSTQQANAKVSETLERLSKNG